MKKVIRITRQNEVKYFTNKKKAYEWLKNELPKWGIRSYSKIIKDLAIENKTWMADAVIEIVEIE